MGVWVKTWWVEENLDGWIKLDGWRKTWMVGSNLMGGGKPGWLDQTLWKISFCRQDYHHLYTEVALGHKPMRVILWLQSEVKNLSHWATCIVCYTIYKCLPQTISNKIIHFLIFFISTSQLSNNYKYLLIN